MLAFLFVVLCFVLKFVISKHHARGDFSNALLLELSRTKKSAKMKLSFWGLDANFVGSNWPLRGTICLAEEYRFSNP